VHRNHSGKGTHGFVTLVFERSAQFELVCEVTWPKGDDYTEAVATAVRGALADLRLPYQVLCHLTEIRWDEIDSCAAGFAKAARQATFAALEPYK
jgi:hypothetical protein